jgi:hypothetical protein
MIALGHVFPGDKRCWVAESLFATTGHGRYEAATADLFQTAEAES